MVPLLSDNFSLAEATVSEKASRAGFDNTPDSHTIDTMYKTAICMERVRCILGNKSLHVNSWFRCLRLNRLLGSKDSSQHLTGEAVDFITPFFGDPIAVCKKLIENADLIRYDQLILEHEWVHVSFAIATGAPRSQVLSLLENGTYATGLTTKQGVPL